MRTYCILNPNSYTESDSNIVEGLSIRGLNIMMNKSNISIYSDIKIFLKGEIYNLQILKTTMGLPVDSSAEFMIIQLYKTYGMEYTLKILDGVFSFILFDYYYENIISNVYIVKDNFGIIPFYCFTYKSTILFTDTQCMPDKYREHILCPGSYSRYELGHQVSAEWLLTSIANKPYFLVPTSIITSPVSISLYKLSECMITIILKMMHTTNEVANGVVEKLFSQIDVRENIQYDVEVCNITNDENIYFSPVHYFVDPTSVNNMLEYDYKIREKIQQTVFEDGKKYPFYDKSFIYLYFSIPLEMRYNYHTRLFSYHTTTQNV
jgi:hypothetical protein